MNDELMNEGVFIMNEWYTVPQASEKTAVPGETVRRYVRQYGDFLQLRRGEKRSYLIHESSLDVIRKIRYLLEQGNQREQIENILQQTEAITIQTNDESMNEYFMSLPQLQRETAKRMEGMAEQMQRQSEQIQKQNELIEKLTDRLDKQQDYISSSIEKRDQKLTQIMDDMANQKEAEERKGLFRKLFGKREGEKKKERHYT